jgi:hypothetical protein
VFASENARDGETVRQRFREKHTDKETKIQRDIKTESQKYRRHKKIVERVKRKTKK